MLKIQKYIEFIFKKINYIKKYILLFFIVFFFAQISPVYAIQLNKTIYQMGEPILTVGSGGLIHVFSYENAYEAVLPSYDNGINLLDYFNYVPIGYGNYVAREFVVGDSGCYLYGYRLEDCQLDPDFVNEFLFTVLNPPDGGDTPVLDTELTPVTNNLNYIPNYFPEVSITSPVKGSVFSDFLTVDYKATDKNDDTFEKSTYGLGLNPVSIFYSDKIAEWYDSFVNESDEIKIADNQPAVGKYKWSVKDLVPGSLYRIIVEAKDMASFLGQGVSELFKVDFTQPVFTVSSNPPAVRSGEVTISVDSSKDLSDIPEVTVTQNGAATKLVTMTGSKSHYEGIYNVISGFDGTAVVSVSGTDIAGNTGKEIISGGTFSVGMNPPSSPKINNYTENIVTNNDSVDISGSARVDTEVILMVNGAEVSRVKPDIKGAFAFSGIKLDKVKNNGLNYLNIVSSDPLGSLSTPAVIKVKYNIPPIVKILKPIDKDTLSNISNITVEGKDENNDTILYTYQILSSASFNNKIFNWITISDINPSSSFPWNTTEVEDGNYMIKVIANDGTAKTESSTVEVTVKNVLPFFRFEDGRSTTTNLSNIVIKGKALTSTNINPRPSIVSVAYSMDNGKTWTPVRLINDIYSAEKKFSVGFVGLKEGVYPVLFRTKDSRGFIGKIIYPIIVDKTAPKAPIVTSPKILNGINVNDINDENLKVSGLQIGISGSVEPYNTVTLSYGENTLTTKSLPTGTFSFSDVSFDKKDKYDLNLFTTDEAGNKSPVISIPLLYNNLPVISFISPKPFKGLSDKSIVSWSIKDIDNDSLSNVIVSYRNKDKDTLFKNLASDANSIGTYTWDTTNLPESNNYELKISVNDKYSSTSSVESFSIDRTPPELLTFVYNKDQINTKAKSINFVGSGEAKDNLSGIEFVEYSIDDGNGVVSPWYKATITSGYLKNKATFSINHTITTGDGSYKVYARTIDTSGNISSPLSISISIDKTAPRIGGFFLEKNDINLNPDDIGNISIYKNSTFVFNISLEDDTKNASIKIGSQSFILKKNISSGLWSTDISMNRDSIEKILITAEDGSGNIIEDKEIGSISIVVPGIVSVDSSELIVGANINVLKLDNSTNQYNDFSISSDGSSSVSSNQSGEYNLVLPAGEYRLVVSGLEINTLNYPLKLDRPSIVNVNFNVSKMSGIMKFINSILGIFK